MLIDVFNDSCKNITASYLKVIDDSMSVIRFWTTEKGNLIHLSYIFRKLKPLGKEFKKPTCYITGDFLFVEVRRRK